MPVRRGLHRISLRIKFKFTLQFPLLSVCRLLKTEMLATSLKSINSFQLQCFSSEFGHLESGIWIHIILVQF